MSGNVKCGVCDYCRSPFVIDTLSKFKIKAPSYFLLSCGLEILCGELLKPLVRLYLSITSETNSVMLQMLLDSSSTGMGHSWNRCEVGDYFVHTHVEHTLSGLSTLPHPRVTSCGSEPYR